MTFWYRNKKLIHTDKFSFRSLFKSGQSIIMNNIQYTVLEAYLDSNGNQSVEIE